MLKKFKNVKTIGGLICLGIALICKICSGISFWVLIATYIFAFYGATLIWSGIKQELSKSVGDFVQHKDGKIHIGGTSNVTFEKDNQGNHSIKFGTKSLDEGQKETIEPGFHHFSEDKEEYDEATGEKRTIKSKGFSFSRKSY